MSTAAPPISAFGPLHGRQAPPPGRQPTIRRQSRPHSGPLRAFQTRRCTSGYPREIRKVPVNAVSQRRWLRPVRHAGVCLTRNRRPRVRSSSCCSAPTTAASRRAAGQVRASSGSMSTAAPPISAFGPLHGRQAPPPGRQPTIRRQSRPHSGPLKAFQTRRCTSGYPREIRKVPVNAVSQRRWLRPVRHAGTRTLNIKSDTGAPSPSWHPQAHHGVAYTDLSNASMALMASLYGRDLPTLSSAASSCCVPPAVFRSARRSPIEQNSPWSTKSRPLCARPSARRPQRRRRPPAT